MEDATLQGGRSKHALDEGSELDVAVVEAGRDGASKLDLVGLKAMAKLILVTDGRVCQM